MSTAFTDIESSVEEGRPLYLYRFNIGADQYRLARVPIDTVFAGITYTPIAITHSELSASSEAETNAIDITIPQSHALALKYQNTPPGQRGIVEIRKVHHNSLSEAAEYKQIFQGFIANTTFRGNTDCIFKCNPLTNDLRRTGPRYKWAHLCNHTWGDERCKVVVADYSFTGTVSSVDGDIITVDGATSPGATPIPRPDGFFGEGGGYVKLVGEFGDDYRLIMSQDNDDMRLLLPFIENITGATVTLFAGCTHDITECANKFSNTDNFGGYPYIPSKNIFKSELRGA